MPLAPSSKPSLFFAFVKPVGANLGVVRSALRQTLALAGYGTVEIRLSKLLCRTALADDYDTSSTDTVVRMNAMMSAGDALRTLWRPDGIARLAVREALRVRKETSADDPGTKESRLEGGTWDGSQQGMAFVFSSLMHPAEVHFLRALYGDRLFVISTFSGRAKRLEWLTEQLIPDFNDDGDVTDRAKARDAAEDLLRRERGLDFRYGDGLSNRRAKVERLNVEKTFPMADMFVDLDSSEADLRAEITRLVKLIFGDPFGVSRPHEVGMALAFTAAEQSSCLARRVGASIVRDGYPLAIGRNDLPQAKGGQFTIGNAIDDAAVRSLPDASEGERTEVFSDALRALFRVTDWEDEPTERIRPIAPDDEEQFQELVRWLMDREVITSARIFDLIEFNPTVHAEMSAITGAAREGISLRGSTLYTTTFPCHECTRHIVSTGILQVIYLEPYVKSRAEELFADQIVLRAAGDDSHVGDEAAVVFSPFMGIAPRSHSRLFSWLERKNSKGEVKRFEIRRDSKLRPGIWPAEITEEQEAEIERSLERRQELIASEIEGAISVAAAAADSAEVN